MIVLQSDPAKAFCAGASFDELLAVKTPEEGKAFFMGFANVINAMRQCPQPIIGRIHGKAVGGGVGLIAACDYALATIHTEVNTNTKIKLSIENRFKIRVNVLLQNTLYELLFPASMSSPSPLHLKPFSCRISGRRISKRNTRVEIARPTPRITKTT